MVKLYKLIKDIFIYIYKDIGIFRLIPKLAWPMQIYEVSLTKVETMERLISKFIKKNGWEYLTP